MGSVAAEGVREALRGSRVGDSERFLRKSLRITAAAPESVILDNSLISFVIFWSSAGLRGVAALPSESAEASPSDSDFLMNTFSRT